MCKRLGLLSVGVFLCIKGVPKDINEDKLALYDIYHDPVIKAVIYFKNLQILAVRRNVTVIDKKCRIYYKNYTVSVREIQGISCIFAII